MSIIIHCPFCNQKYELKEFVEGADCECEKCHQSFTLNAYVIDFTSKMNFRNNFVDKSTKQTDNSNQKNSEHPNLIVCPDCGRQISIFAKTCPGCGHPFENKNSVFDSSSSDNTISDAQSGAQSLPPGVQTIERTSKTWKIAMLLGGLLMAVSFGPCILEPGSDSLEAFAFLFITGFAISVAARVGAWWENG